MVKRILQFTAMLMCFALLFGCDFYAERRPAANPDEQWVSEEPQMYFTWTEEVGSHWGEITVNGVTTKVRVLFDYGCGVDVDKFNASFSAKNRLFSGQCEFGEDELIITVTDDDANLFRGDLPSFVFEKRRQGDGSSVW